MPEPDLLNLNAPEPSPDTSGGDPAVWTLLGEAGTNPQGQLAVGSTLINRATKLGKTAQDVATDPINGYEAWNDPKARAQTQRRYPVGSPEYDAAQATLAGLQSGKTAPLPYTHFYGPKAQADLGRPAPDWSKGQTGTDIGGNRFYTLPDQLGGSEPDLFALGGGPHGELPTNINVTPGHGFGGAGQPDLTTQHRLAVAFLAKNGLFDPRAVVGSSSNPEAQMPGQGPPADKGTWYLTPAGQLRQTGDPTPDYIPTYEKIVSLRAENAKLQSPATRSGYGGAQSFADFGQSLNKLSGGAFGATGSMLMGHGFDLPGMAQTSLASDVAERNQFNLLYGNDPYAQGTRMAGQVGLTSLAGAGAAKGLGMLGPGGSFLAGEAPGALALPSSLAGGALQGGLATGLTSATSDVPLGEQLRTGLEFGGALGAGGRLLEQGGARLASGGSLAEGPIKDLANLAAQKYGMTGDAGLRAGQIRGAAGDRGAATADSELLGSSPKFFANNQAQRQKWMQGVTSTYGDPSGDVSEGSLQASRDRIGGVMNDVADKTQTIDASAVPDKLDMAVKEAGQVLGAGDAKPLKKLVENIKSTIQPDGTMSGETYQALTRKDGPLMVALGKASTPYVGMIKDSLDDALQASADPADVAALQNARWQYKNLMTVAKAAPDAGPDGVLPAGAFKSAVKSQFKNMAFQGAGDLGELNQIRQGLMKEPPNSFTANRSAFRLGGADAAIGLFSELGGLALNHPELGATALAGIAGNKVLQAGLKAAHEARLGPGAGNRLLSNQPPMPVKSFAPYAPAAALIGKNLLLSPHQ